jgi:hypothetical protein
MNLFEIIRSLETNEEVHLGRILILLNQFSSEKNKGEIEGLTKLAKLDFLLRYPVYLERALKAVGKNITQVGVQPFERRSVESKMVRFKYGPWDFRYRKFINVLVAKELVYIRIEGRSYHLGLTQKGNDLANELIKQKSLADLSERAKLIKRNFNYSGTNLMYNVPLS